MCNIKELENQYIKNQLPIPTNTQWQNDFIKLKQNLCFEPEYEKSYSIGGLETPYESFLESVLNTIRSGKTDICFYIYQIVDLLKHEKNLKTRYIPSERYFMVWL